MCVCVCVCVRAHACVPFHVTEAHSDVHVLAKLACAVELVPVVASDHISLFVFWDAHRETEVFAGHVFTYNVF